MGRRRVQALAQSAEEPIGDLVLSTMHGFGNRIRSIAAAWALAAELNRRLHIVWHADDSCGARMEDIIHPRLASGDTLVCNSLLALSAAAYYHAGSEHSDRLLISCYEPFGFKVGQCDLYASDVLPLAQDVARCTHVVGSRVPATLQGRQRPPPRDWVPSAKTVRQHEHEHATDGRARGAFYRALLA